jgi:hypothetical protein
MNTSSLSFIHPLNYIILYFSAINIGDTDVVLCESVCEFVDAVVDDKDTVDGPLNAKQVV